jgi:chromosome segregation ATPase
MIEYEQLDQTMLAMMGIYRRQVTDLKTSLQYAEQEIEGLKHAKTQAQTLRKGAEGKAEHFRQKWLEEETKTEKLEDIIDTLKIELQDARADATAAKEHHEEDQ